MSPAHVLRGVHGQIGSIRGEPGVRGCAMRPAEIDEGTCQLLDIDRIFTINSEVQEKIFKSKVFLKPRVSFLLGSHHVQTTL